MPYYRFLYHAVGEDYHWLSRRKLSDAEPAAIIQDPRNELHVLHVAGSPAGFAELDHRQPDDIELVQFGLMPDFIDQGLGKWFLQWTIDKVCSLVVAVMEVQSDMSFLAGSSHHSRWPGLI